MAYWLDVPAVHDQEVVNEILALRHDAFLDQRPEQAVERDELLVSQHRFLAPNVEAGLYAEELPSAELVGDEVGHPLSERLHEREILALGREVHVEGAGQRIGSPLDVSLAHAHEEDGNPGHPVERGGH